MDPKKQKKFEKEEKEFRKKFKVCHSNMFQPHLQYLLSYFACFYIYTHIYRYINFKSVSV